MSQPLLFFLALPPKILSLNSSSNPPTCISKLLRWKRHLSTRFVDKRFKQSLARHNRRSFDRFAQETVAARAAWVRIVVHFGSDELRAYAPNSLTDTSDTVLRGNPGNERNHRNSSQSESPCNRSNTRSYFRSVGFTGTCR